LPDLFLWQEHSCRRYKVDVSHLEDLIKVMNQAAIFIAKKDFKTNFWTFPQSTFPQRNIAQVEAKVIEGLEESCYALHTSRKASHTFRCCA
jgi:hypothetical protein